MGIAALVFDVDGTLADTEEAHRASFNHAFERHGLGWNWSRERYRELLQVTGGKERIAHYIESLALPAAEARRLLALVPELHAEKTRAYGEVVRDGAVPLRSGVARLLDEAQSGGLRLAIASTTTAANVDALLHACLGARGLSMFDVIACGDLVRHKKPAPDIYTLALRHLGIGADEAIAFEDSVNGLRAAAAAGVWTVVTPTYWTADGDWSEAGLVLPDLGDPQAPLAGEPGGRLRHAAWLTLTELLELAAPVRATSEVHRLYRGLPEGATS